VKRLETELGDKRLENRPAMLNCLMRAARCPAALARSLIRVVLLADVARDHDEAVGEPDGRLHGRYGARTPFAREQEPRI
jgi:hypothetical protein